LNFKIDENLPIECSEELRQAGFSSETAQEENLSGTEDSLLIEFCKRESRILVTLDLDFADVRAYPPGTHPGIVVLRSASQDKQSLVSLTQRLIPILAKRPPEGQLWIVEQNRIRVRES
jgi:predicted nuclease of predicted toxin-antitoxin system